MPLLELPDVTLCAADSAFVELSVRALTLSMEQCRFGDAILFSDVAAAGPFRHVAIPPLNSVAAYSQFCLRRLPALVHTPFVLIVQWDGYVVNADAWANAFRKYDYVGAAWHKQFVASAPLVGNGGFSLRSARLLDAARRMPPIGGFWEDRAICHVFRPDLERRFAIRFAPPKLADRFSYEFTVPEALPFGFHGIQHMWRHGGGDEAFAAVADRIDIARTDPDKVLQLIRNCIDNGMEKSATSLYRRYRMRYPPLLISIVLRNTLGEDVAQAEMRKLEALAGPGA